MLTGWHQFASPIWVAENDVLYRVIGWNDEVESFATIHDLLMSDMRLQFADFCDFASGALYVTFEDQELLYWDGCY